DRALAGFQFEPQLFLNRGENRRAIRVDGAVTVLVVRLALAGGPFELDIEAAREARLVCNGLAEAPAEEIRQHWHVDGFALNKPASRPDEPARFRSCSQQLRSVLRDSQRVDRHLPALAVNFQPKSVL